MVGWEMCCSQREGGVSKFPAGLGAHLARVGGGPSQRSALAWLAYSGQPPSGSPRSHQK